MYRKGQLISLAFQRESDPQSFSSRIKTFHLLGGFLASSQGLLSQRCCADQADLLARGEARPQPALLAQFEGELEPFHQNRK